MKFNFIGQFSILLLLGASPVLARPIITHSYSEFAVNADLIVIAQTSESTRETGEIETMPGLVTHGPDGRESPLQAMRLETRFKLLVVLKGTETADVFTLNHYLAVSKNCAFNCFSNLKFDPNDLGKSNTFLMFLKREKEGRYIPALDNLDITKSISPLPRESFPTPPPPPRSQ